jgi:hypothetical protein
VEVRDVHQQRQRNTVDATEDRIEPEHLVSDVAGAVTREERRESGEMRVGCGGQDHPPPSDDNSGGSELDECVRAGRRHVANARDQATGHVLPPGAAEYPQSADVEIGRRPQPLAARKHAWRSTVDLEADSIIRDVVDTEGLEIAAQQLEESSCRCRRFPTADR